MVEILHFVQNDKCQCSFWVTLLSITQVSLLFADSVSMRVLVYGFGPYERFTDNITRRIIKNLPAAKNLRKLVFPVRFHRKQFIDAIEKYRPEIVLGMGQCSRGRLIRIEQRAVNHRRSRPGERRRSVAPRGPRSLRVTLELEKLPIARQAQRSRRAGDYVCNFSMYVMLEYLRRCYPAARYGFIHVPYDYDEKSALRFVSQCLQALNRRNITTKDAKDTR